MGNLELSDDEARTVFAIVIGASWGYVEPQYMGFAVWDICHRLWGFVAQSAGIKEIANNGYGAVMRQGEEE